MLVPSWCQRMRWGGKKATYLVSGVIWKQIRTEPGLELRYGPFKPDFTSSWSSWPGRGFTALKEHLACQPFSERDNVVHPATPQPRLESDVLPLGSQAPRRQGRSPHFHKTPVSLPLPWEILTTVPAVYKKKKKMNKDQRFFIHTV